MLGPKGESYHPCVRRTVESPRCGSSRSALRVEELGVINDVRHPFAKFGLTLAFGRCPGGRIRHARPAVADVCRPLWSCTAKSESIAAKLVERF